jgi:hypothetical protein
MLQSRKHVLHLHDFILYTGHSELACRLQTGCRIQEITDAELGSVGHQTQLN